MSAELTRREALKGAAAVTAAAALAPLGALAADAIATAGPPPAEMCGTMALDLMHWEAGGRQGLIDIPDFLRRDEEEMGDGEDA